MEQSMIIFFTLLAFLLGVIVGIVIHSLAAISNFNSALDDAYEIGYVKGKEEAISPSGACAKENIAKCIKDVV